MMPNTYRVPARSVGLGAMIRRRTPAGALVDHVIDRIELRPGDEVRIDLVDPANGWGAFLVLDGSDEVDVVDADPAMDDDDHDVVVDLPDAAELRRAYDAGEWCGECRLGVVEDPPCCTQPPEDPTPHHRRGDGLTTDELREEIEP